MRSIAGIANLIHPEVIEQVHVVQKLFKLKPIQSFILFFIPRLQQVLLVGLSRS